MPEEILNNNFQNKIVNFIKKNLKKIIISLLVLIIILLSFLFYNDLQKKKRNKDFRKIYRGYNFI